MNNAVQKILFQRLRAEHWTLFLDRDGVINKRIPGSYISNTEAFEFLEGVESAMVVFKRIFKRIIVVTNQQGIGKRWMDAEQLHTVHHFMQKSIEKAGGRIDGIYFCPFLATQDPPCRKPSGQMAQMAQRDFPEIDLTNSIMVGDMPSDMEFGRRLGMTTIMVSPKGTQCEMADIQVESLKQWADQLKD